MIADYHTELGSRLKKCREDAGQRVEDMAIVLGVSTSQYRKIERGVYGLNDEKIVLLYEYLGIDPLYLLTGKRTPTQKNFRPTTATDSLNVMQDFFKYITELSDDKSNKTEG